MATKYSKLSYNELVCKEAPFTDAYKKCSLCPWKCGVDRTKGELGVCRSGTAARVSSATPHFGEEPVISGTRGSGTIFFSNCHMKCDFCQNYQISQQGHGEVMSNEALAAAMLSLQEKGCHNINLVSAAHFLPNIVSAIVTAVERGLKLPVVYNSSGYESVETVKMLEGIVDVYLPDMKYSDDANALRISKVRDYVANNRAALIEMYRQVGQLDLDENGIAVRGLLVRHLVLPNDLAGSRSAFEFLSGEISKDVNVAIMSQYHPAYNALGDKVLGRKLTEEEYGSAVKWAESSGLHNILVQELGSSDVLLPDFERDDPFV